MIIIHIVSSIREINFGVWKAATFATDYLDINYGIRSELWACSCDEFTQTDLELPLFFFSKKQKKKKGFKNWLNTYSPNDTIIVTHGAWLKPTKLGNWAKKNGYKWIFTPHGMFEHYSIIDNGKQVHHGLKKGLNTKWIYFSLIEKQLVRKADAIRSVSENERKNLNKLLHRDTVLIYNGITITKTIDIKKNNEIITVLFLSRLHKKKGIIHLVKAWSEVMYNNKRFKLIIAGPDEGELAKIRPYLINNIEYVGALYGEAKNRVLNIAHYFFLPSYSEGFPTSVVEAMSYGMIPIITEGCNFPEVFNQNLGYQIESDKESIKKALKTIASNSFNTNLSEANQKYIERNLTEKKIASDYLQLYQSVLSEK